MTLDTRTDSEKLTEALELVVEVRKSHSKEVPVVGPLVEASRDIRQVRDFLEVRE